MSARIQVADLLQTVPPERQDGEEFKDQPSSEKYLTNVEEKRNRDGHQGKPAKSTVGSSDVVPVKKRTRTTFFGQRNAAKAAQDHRQWEIQSSHEYQSFKRIADDTVTSEWVFLPHSKELQDWDLVMLWSLIFVAIVTPFQVGFLQELGFRFSVLFAFNTVIDLLFLGDIVVQFHRSYFDGKLGRTVTDLRAIRKHYLCGWCTLDILSIFPFEIMSEIMSPDSGRAGQVRAVRLVKLMRLIKLCRMHKTSRAIHRIQVSLEWSYASFQLLLYSWIVVVVIHWLACLWGLVGKPHIETCEPDLCVGQLTGDPTWLTLSMRVDSDENAPSLEGFSADVSDLAFATPDSSAWWTVLEMYLASFEFAMCIMVLSYSENVIPCNAFERAIALFCMLIGGGVYAYMIGTICGLLASSDPVASEYQAMSDLLNRYLREKCVVGEQKNRLQEFFNSSYCRDVLHMRHYATVLQMLSPVGQTDLAMRVHEERMSQIRAFMVPDANERGRFLAKVSTSLEPAAFPPLETIFGVGDSAAQIYFLERGLVSATNEKADLFGSVKQSGSYFGLDALVPNARHRFGAQTLTFAVTFSLLSTVLHEVLNSAEYPQTRQRLRTHCIKYHLRAFCRHIVHLAKVEQLICKDGVTLRLGERVFPSKAALEEYKALLKKAPHPKIYNDLRSKVLKQIYMMKFSRASHNNQAELHKFIGPGISFRHKAVRISLREGTEHIISHPDEVQPSARGDGADDDIGSEPPPKGKPRPTKKDHGSRNATHAGNSDEVMVELEQMKRQLEDMRSGIVSELDSRFQEKLDSRFERMENLILELATK